MRLESLLENEKEEEFKKERENPVKLEEAAMEEAVAYFSELLHKDPVILSSINSSMPSTPLHAAVLLGHLDFAKTLLSQKPELAKSLNSHGSSALHLAAAKGHVDIVKELLSMSPDMCFVLDHDGRAPLHLASIKGRLLVLTEFVRVKPEATRVLTRGGESCLHMCVRYNRFEALKVLLDAMKKDQQLVNWKDQNGNTVLHLAVAKKQIEIINYLLTTTEIELHARNANGLTALDVLMQSPRDLRDMEIKQSLEHGKVSTIQHAESLIPNADIAKSSSVSRPQLHSHLSSSISTSSGLGPNKHKQTDWLGRKRSALMIVASLLATVAFQAGLSPPGGVWQSDSSGQNVTKPYEAGQSVMAYNIPRGYGQFMIFNTISFLASLSIILLQISGLPFRRRRWMWTQMVIMWIAISAVTLTYFIALIHMTPDHVQGTVYHVTKISMLGWMSVMAMVVVGNLVRVTRHFLRKYGYIKEDKTSVEEEEENDYF